MLNVGECVIYGRHGLCKVRDILVPAFLEKGTEKQYYMMISAVDAGSVIYVPVEGAEEITLPAKKEQMISADPRSRARDRDRFSSRDRRA